MRRLLVAALVTGILLNLIGWAGNVFVLRYLWPNRVVLVTTALAFVANIVLAFVWCGVYRLLSPNWRRSKLQVALLSAGLVWLGGVARDLMWINNGPSRPDVSLATSILELAAFVVVAPLLPRLLPDRAVTPT